MIVKVFKMPGKWYKMGKLDREGGQIIFLIRILNESTPYCQLNSIFKMVTL